MPGLLSTTIRSLQDRVGSYCTEGLLHIYQMSDPNVTAKIKCTSQIMVAMSSNQTYQTSNYTEVQEPRIAEGGRAPSRRPPCDIGKRSAPSISRSIHHSPGETGVPRECRTLRGGPHSEDLWGLGLVFWSLERLPLESLELSLPFRGGLTPGPTLLPELPKYLRWLAASRKTSANGTVKCDQRSCQKSKEVIILHKQSLGKNITRDRRNRKIQHLCLIKTLSKIRNRGILS